MSVSCWSQTHVKHRTHVPSSVTTELSITTITLLSIYKTQTDVTLFFFLNEDVTLFHVDIGENLKK